MTSIEPTSQNTYMVTTGDGTVVGTVVLNPNGFTAISASGQMVGTFKTMVAAVGAVTGAK